MAVIFGCIFVLVAILSGFMIAGGKPAALLHISEVITICGASIGALIIMSPAKVLKDLLAGMMQFIKGSPYNRQSFLQLLGLFTALSKMIRRDGLLSLDSHLSNPHESALFQRFPLIHHNHHVMSFLSKSLAMILDGNTDMTKVSAALDDEIKVLEREHHAAVAVLNKTSDALPGFGIVAAVLGIVITMQAIDGPASEVGHKVGAALVGTFLGILLSYGYLAPMAGRLEYLGEIEATFFRAIGAGVLAIGAGENAREVVSRTLRIVGTDCRPTDEELQRISAEAA